jgi:hypothetical protein
MSSPAFCSDCNSLFPMLVLLVVKNVLAARTMLSRDEFLLGIAITGAKALLL